MSRADLGSDRAQELIDQITRRYENGGGGQARILQLGPGGLPMSMGSNATFVPPPSGGAPPSQCFSPAPRVSVPNVTDGVADCLFLLQCVSLADRWAE